MHEETVKQLMTCGLYEGVFECATSHGVLAPPAASDFVAPLTHLGGIVYCSGSRKPAGLCAYEAVLEAACCPANEGEAAVRCARRVVLVDDRRAHVEAVGEAMRAAGRFYLGLHYVPHADSASDSAAAPPMARAAVDPFTAQPT